jgi:REP element-mobilizing transposase RayT
MPKRILDTNTYYHIYNRGNRKDKIFYDDLDREYCLRTLKYSLSKYGSEELCAYCLMENHYHLLVKINDPEVFPKVMRDWGAAISNHINSRYRKVGRLFQSRYQSRKVLNGHKLLYVSRYIHRNPLDLPNVGSIMQLLEYPWSSLYQIYNESDNEILRTDHYIRYCRSRNNYVKYVLTRNYRNALSYVNSDEIIDELFKPIDDPPRIK